MLIRLLRVAAIAILLAGMASVPALAKTKKIACGGIGGAPCADGFLCEMPAGHCRAADLQGTCVKKPDICTAHHQPVCGCDGTTYDNDCKRRAAGAQKNHSGHCKKK